MNARLLALSFVAALLSQGALAADVVIIHAGKLLAEPGSAPAAEQSVIVRDGRVAGIAPGYIEASGAGADENDAVAIIDLKNRFVLPGLIDSHVHITSENNPRGRLQRVEQSDADYAIAGAGFARKTLMAGFTTIRDVGAGSGDAIFALRDGIARGDIDGPRLYASGATISVTGGHGDGTQGYRDDIAELLHSQAVCDGPSDCRRAVRNQVRRGADHIKLTATGGVLSNTAAGLEQQFFNDELAAIIDSAHAMGRKATAHAHGLEGINAALRAGVDSIEHGTYLDDESIRLFRKTGAYLVPTLLAGETVVEWAQDPTSFLLAPQRAKALEVGPTMHEMAAKAHKGRVKIAFGTDSGVSRHGENAREFALLVAAGLTPMEAIATATVNAAEHLGRSDVIGTISAGKFADIIAVDGDPLADINALLDVDFVMKEGVVHKNEN
ncbi:MAG: amidohydrolase family protein [Parvularculaceae bacterium]|nr:amidohydrolase family protein [Parvularculaceae bacterium]